jgi:phage terminase small subunit
MLIMGENTIEKSKEKNEDGMTPLQALFIIEYIKDLNGTKAAERAGYGKEYAADQACKLLKLPHIKKEIDRQLQAKATRTLITADKILYEMFQIADCDPEEALEANGDLKPMHEIPIHVRKAISSLEIEAMYEMDYTENKPKRVEVGILKKVKFWSKDRAQENLAKHLRLLSERFEIGGLPGGDFKFPGVTEVFVDSPQDLHEALELAAQPQPQGENVSITPAEPK